LATSDNTGDPRCVAARQWAAHRKNQDQLSSAHTLDFSTDIGGDRADRYGDIQRQKAATMARRCGRAPSAADVGVSPKIVQLARKLMSRRMAIGAIASRAGPANGVASS
jgi:hypothetical protein